MPEHPPLSAAELRRRCDPESLPFQTTADLEPLTEVLGQDRAVSAFTFGVELKSEGYNLFACGPSGIGKLKALRTMLEERAKAEPAPPDWCYVHNFEEPTRPKILRLPAGRGGPLKQDMLKLVGEIRAAVPAAFESDDFRARREKIEEEGKQRQEAALQAIEQFARSIDVALIRAPNGFAVAPLRKGETISQEEFARLSEKEQQKAQRAMEQVQERVHEFMHEVPKWQREFRNKASDLFKEFTSRAVGHLLDELRKRHSDLPQVVRQLDAIQTNIVESADEFFKPHMQEVMGLGGGSVPVGSVAEHPFFRRFLVNLLVDNSGRKGAPVIYEDHPTHPNLVGRIESVPMYGMLVTDFSLIRSGALHRANGGYLVLDAVRLLTQPLAWDLLKRVLRGGEIRIESLAQMLSLLSTVSLDPEAVPADLKVVLVGDRMLYYLLSSFDPDFNELFKVFVDFGDDIDWTPDNLTLYARFVAALAKSESLRPFGRDAVARIIEQGARRSEDREKLLVHHRPLNDLLKESDHFAAQEKAAAVGAAHVQKALDARVYRSDRIRQIVYERIQKGDLLITTSGSKAGQVNGLSVMELGGFAFARPSRITARTRPGGGKVMNIDREVALSGPIHSKGVLILQGYLGGHYLKEMPLSLAATLVFEQSYAGVEGDSASSAELYALLSALSGVPVRQSIAVTGSVNQFGELQPVGAINEKIEGFFDVCSVTGLTGEQGVLIPKPNVRHLMLRDDVVEACRQGRFRIWAAATIDEGMEILTGVTAGSRGPDGQFPADTLNAKVEAALAGYATVLKQFGATAGADEKEPKKP